MKAARSATLLILALSLAPVTACSEDEEAAEPMDTEPFAFLVGDYGVEVAPTFSNCAGELYFPAETWVVQNTLASVHVTPIPDASEPPEAVPVTTSPTDEGGEPTDEGGELTEGSADDAAMPPSYSGLLGSTLAWSATGEEQGLTEGGCLERRTTLLELQFTDAGEVMGTRAVFLAYTGGPDCPADCRMTFDVEGAREAE
ncbi:MAG TPA: hypothetical protein PLU22_00675 [Polyangiaceae bacterium]|nr:hypothetical protein [Polyangiaceae bacterium]